PAWPCRSTPARRPGWRAGEAQVTHCYKRSDPRCGLAQSRSVAPDLACNSVLLVRRALAALVASRRRGLGHRLEKLRLHLDRGLVEAHHDGPLLARVEADHRPLSACGNAEARMQEPDVIADGGR